MHRRASFNRHRDPVYTKEHECRLRMERWIQTHGRPFGSEFMMMDRLQVLNLWWALGESLNRTVLVGSLHFKFQTYKCCEHRAGGSWRAREDGGSE